LLEILRHYPAPHESIQPPVRGHQVLAGDRHLNCGAFDTLNAIWVRQTAWQLAGYRAENFAGRTRATVASISPLTRAARISCSVRGSGIAWFSKHLIQIEMMPTCTKVSILQTMHSAMAFLASITVGAIATGLASSKTFPQPVRPTTFGSGKLHGDHANPRLPPIKRRKSSNSSTASVG
jgi:hypothetical protein